MNPYSSEEYNPSIFTSHRYDLDVKKVLQETKRKLEKSNNISAENKAVYCRSVLELIVLYCRRKRISFKNNPVLTIDSRDNFYMNALSYALISIDLLKIEAFLDYQFKIYQGEGSFIDLMEHHVYDIVESRSVFLDTYEIQVRIMNWVTEKRKMQQYHQSIVNQFNTSNTKTTDNHKKKKISISSIAYIYRYLNESDSKTVINFVNCKEIAKKFGYTAVTSGNKLLQYYNKYFKKSARIDFIEGSKISERSINERFKEVHQYFVDNEIRDKAYDQLMSDYKLFCKRNISHLEEEDFIHF